MANSKHLLWFPFFLIIIAPAYFVHAQTPDTKPRATVSVSGRVSVGDKPAPGIIVSVLSTSAPPQILGQTVSDMEGKYRLNGLTPGQVNLAAFAPTYVMPATNAFGEPRVLNLSSDENVEGIDFKLVRGGVITGRVIDAEGKPLIEEGVTLTLLDEKGQPTRAGMVRPSNPFSLSTDDRGIYRIFGLAAGRYKVSVGENAGRSASLRSGYYQRTYYPDTTDASKASIVELGEGGEAKNIDITVAGRSRTYSVSGRVIDAENGQPIAGVNYSFGVLQQNQTQSFIAGLVSNTSPTNSKGEFRLEGIAPGRYAVQAGSGSFMPSGNQPAIYSEPLPFEITDSDVTDLEIKAQHGQTISGTVITDGISDKKALAGVSQLIVIANVEPRPNTIQTFNRSRTAAIAEDGTFQIENLQPGTVTLNVGSFSSSYARGYTAQRIVAADRELPNRKLELAPGQNVSGVRIYVTYGTGVVKGEVRIEGGTLPSDVMLMVVLMREGQGSRTGNPDVRGRFMITGVAAGTYDAVLQIMPLNPNNLSINLPKPTRQTITVNDNSETQLTFNLNFTPRDGP